MKPLLRLVLPMAALAAAGPAQAWIYPEHRDIAVLAVQNLDPERKAQFDRLWLLARTGNEQRLCEVPADGEQGTTPVCIDWAALPAIAGDHSCSSADLVSTALDSAWILQLADVAAQLKLDLARIPVTATAEQLDGAASPFADAKRRFADEKSRAARLNALRTADTRMQRADPQYATRADANLAHFVLSRPGTSLDADEHGKVSYGPGIELNAGGVYAWYHLAALDKASKLANEPGLSEVERETLVRSMLFDEAFALHFLEDMFAAGHVAGSWGDVSQRKGTHDFYNQNGLEAFTWTGRDNTLVLMGDAHMRPEDAALVAETVRASLEQVLDAAAGRRRGERALPYVAATSVQPETFDVCKSKTFPARPAPPVTAGPTPYREPLREVLLPTRYRASRTDWARCRVRAARSVRSWDWPAPSTCAARTAACWPDSRTGARSPDWTCRSARASAWRARWAIRATASCSCNSACARLRRRAASTPTRAWARGWTAT